MVIGHDYKYQDRNVYFDWDALHTYVDIYACAEIERIT